MASLLSSAPTWSCSTIPTLANKIFLVTGGTAGIGFGIVSNLLSHNPEKVYMLSQKPDHAELAKQELEKYGDPKKVEFVKCDLEDLKEVDATAKRLKGELKRIDALVCNAGIGVGVYNLSKDGIDTHFQVNHLSQMHLILTLLPNLLHTAKTHSDARLVLQSSDLHKLAPSSTSFSTLAEINTDIGPSYLYNRSKLAQILFIRGLVQRLNDGRLGAGEAVANLFCNATHPGAVSTGQQEQAEDAYGLLGKAAVKVARPFMKDPITEGCLPALWAVTAGEVKSENVTGQYITPPNRVSEPSKQAQDQGLADRLWELSEKLLREKLA
ncbi:NAD(P)-binding protein [Wilcoxina mikolae CBS 423.85]|nr:NAD(P)-binding protein [Wilcoxina mikolae CBS 423.85]